MCLINYCLLVFLIENKPVIAMIQSQDHQNMFSAYFNGNVTQITIQQSVDYDVNTIYATHIH